LNRAPWDCAGAPPGSLPHLPCLDCHPPPPLVRPCQLPDPPSPLATWRRAAPDPLPFPFHFFATKLSTAPLCSAPVAAAIHTFPASPLLAKITRSELPPSSRRPSTPHPPPPTEESSMPPFSNPPPPRVHSSSNHLLCHPSPSVGPPLTSLLSSWCCRDPQHRPVADRSAVAGRNAAAPELLLHPIDAGASQ
jgi:hypothetical protein